MTKVKQIFPEKTLKVIGNHSRLSSIHLQAQSQYLSAVIHAGAHDLRSPLTVLKPYTDFLKKIEDKEQKTQILEKMKAAVDKAEAIINGLVEYTDIFLLDAPSIGKQYFETVWQEVQTLLCPTIADATIHIKTNFLAAPVIHYPQRYLEELLYQLVLNSIQYRHPGRVPNIQVSSQRVKQKVILTITDNGKGFDPEMQIDKIGMPFTKLKSNHKNVGLGLAKVRAIVEKNRGLFKMQSSSQGTTIALHLLPYQE
ncbi:MAG: HAMP domain-containing sensor histidine kinase [Bacteroidota bacterium]